MPTLLISQIASGPRALRDPLGQSTSAYGLPYSDRIEHSSFSHRTYPKRFLNISLCISESFLLFKFQ